MRAGILLTLLLFPLCALGIEQPLRDPALLLRAQEEAVARVPSARVVLADYDLLQRDFPETRNLSHKEIDEWLLGHAAYVSKPQVAQTKVNTAITTNGQEAVAYRPAGYNRAVVLKAGSGLIDAKGAGTLYPAQSDHSNGLATLGESIREFLYEKLVRRVLAHAGLPTETVGTYAIFDLGFDVKHADGSTSPAGLILRQAHERIPDMNSMFDDTRAAAIEKVLRRYGLTSAGAYRDEAVERINIQGTKDSSALIDFGGYLDAPEFHKPAKNFRPVLIPGRTEFPQPDPAIQVPFEVWGYSRTGIADPKMDNPWIEAHELADRLRAGTANRQDAEALFHRFMDPVEAKLALVPPKPRPPGCPDSFAKIGAWMWMQHIK